jgi:hypothetical protein
MLAPSICLKNVMNARMHGELLAPSLSSRQRG